MTKPVREHRVQIMLNDAEIEAIDNFRYENRIPTRSAAIRRLAMIGLQSLEAPVDEEDADDDRHT